MKNTNAQQAAEREAEAAEAREAAAEQAEAVEDDATAEVEGDEPVAEQAAEPAPGDGAVTERADEEDEPAAAEEDDPVTVTEAEVEARVEEDAIASELARARAEAESYLDDLRRLQADFDNYRKRTLREQTARTASASQALVARLLPVLDNFELAVSAAEQSRDFDRMLKGVEMVLGALREVLEGEGLVKIEAEGKPFDPERHEAVIAVEQEDAEPGTIVDIVRTGYELGGKVLRPAMVKVAK
ncbi:MAG TPA: nucleotide exchange factor GrpE [Actinomycetota bacterium]|nr:nucleotide exchange factor GrpE [Actinomycetota bacterium]